MVKIRHCLDEWQTIRSFYRNKAFREVDLAMRQAYLFRNPYRMLRRFLQKRGESEIFQYGETPLLTMDYIVREFGIQKNSLLYELGSGRGRAALFLSTVHGIRTLGIEQLPSFVMIANQIGAKYGVPASFISGDFSRLEGLEEPDFIYLCGTCLSDEIIYKLTLINYFKTRWITVSYPLSDYSSRFEIEKKLSGAYLWGETDIYLNKVKK